MNARTMTMYKPRILITSLLSLSLLLPISVGAQETTVTRDLEMWNNFALSKKIGDSVEGLIGRGTEIYQRHIAV